MKTKFLEKKKKGAASIYIIVVTALLFSIITAGFINLVVSELENSTENSLSQSAYDAALAGVEDAKLALNEYYKCANQGYITAGSSFKQEAFQIGGNPAEKCESINYLIQRENQPCNIVPLILGIQGDPYDPQPTYIEETTTNAQAGNKNTVQAYTCVTLNTTPDDYQGTLNETNSVAVIPLIPAKDGGEVGTGEVDDIKEITIDWWSQQDVAANGDEPDKYENIDGDGKVKFGTDKPLPPTISAQLLQTGGASFSLEEFSDTMVDGDEDTTNRGTLWLVPSNEPGATEMINAKSLAESNNHDTTQKTDSKNTAQQIKCDDYDGAYICSVTIKLPEPVGGLRSSTAGTFALILSSVYNEPAVDFRVTMKDESGNTKKFYNVQVAVDSTGRANDVFRRVEGRIEFHEADFPIPQYALESLGEGDDGGLIKDFYVTQNCWTVQNGNVTTCAGGDSHMEENR